MKLIPFKYFPLKYRYDPNVIRLILNKLRNDQYIRIESHSKIVCPFWVAVDTEVWHSSLSILNKHPPEYRIDLDVGSYHSVTYLFSPEYEKLGALKRFIQRWSWSGTHKLNTSLFEREFRREYFLKEGYRFNDFYWIEGDPYQFNQSFMDCDICLSQ